MIYVTGVIFFFVFFSIGIFTAAKQKVNRFTWGMWTSLFCFGLAWAFLWPISLMALVDMLGARCVELYDEMLTKPEEETGEYSN